MSLYKFNIHKGSLKMKSVAINGFGTIGKRVADAVAAQDDMKVKKRDILYTLEFLKGKVSLKKQELKLQVLLKT